MTAISDSKTPIQVRTADQRDYPAIARIQQASPEAAQWPVGDYSGFELLLGLVTSGNGPVPAGFCAWRQSTPEEAELLNLAVTPASRRRGVASALLAALAGAAKGSVFLEVAERNTPAIALYERHGWVRSGIRNGYYDGGNVNAVVMVKRRW